MTKNRLPWLMALALGIGLLLWLDHAGTGSETTVAPARSQVILSLPSQTSSQGFAAVEAGPNDTEVTGLGGPLENPLASLDVAALGAIVERPLFTPSRRPPPMPEPVIAPRLPVASPPAPPSPPPGYVLLGVIRDGDRAIALLRGREDGRNIRVEAGDVIGGWEISAVRPASVSLRGQDGTFHDIPLKR